MKITYRFKVKRANKGKIAELRRFASGPWRKGLNYALEIAKQGRPNTAYDLHQSVYRKLREFGLPAQLSCACRDKAAEAYFSHRERGGPLPHFSGAPSIRFNIPRSLKIVERAGNHWALLRLNGRRIALPISGRKKALNRVLEARCTHAEIVFKGRDVYLHVAVPVETKRPEYKSITAVAGVDMNVVGPLLIAVARDISGRVLSVFQVRSGRFNEKRKRFNMLRKSLQDAGKSKKLKSLRRRERNYVSTFLHTATARMMSWAKKHRIGFIAIEDLKGIRKKKASLSKTWNHKLHSWPFRDAAGMLDYKGLREGVRIRPLCAAYSSQYCSRCDGRNTRRSRAVFCCLGCGYGGNAHLNAASNMSLRAVRYVLAAAGRAADKTAERQSGPREETEAAFAAVY